MSNILDQIVAVKWQEVAAAREHLRGTRAARRAPGPVAGRQKAGRAKACLIRSGHSSPSLNKDLESTEEDMAKCYCP